MNLSGGSSLFDLQASLTLDTSGYESAIQSAISTAGELVDAAEAADGISISVNAEVNGRSDVEALAESVRDLDSTRGTADADAQVSGQSDVDTLAGSVTGLDDTSGTAAAAADVSGQSEVDTLSGSVSGLDGVSGTAQAGVNVTGQSDIDALTETVSGLNGITGTASIGVSVTGQAEVDALRDSVTALDGVSGTAQATAEVSGQADVDTLTESVDGLNDTTGTADATAEVTGQDSVDALSDSVDSLDGREATVDVSAQVSGQSDVDALSQSVTDIGSGGASGTASAGIDALTDMIVNGLAGATTFGAISSVYNAIKDLVSGTASLGDSIDKGADRMGMTNTQYQVWDQIMQHCGSDISALKRGMNNLVDPTDEVSEALATLGLNTEEFSNLGRADQFEAVVSALQAMGQTDPSGMEELAKSILGANWQQFATLLQQTPEQMESMRETAEALAMDDSMVTASASYTDALQDMTNAFDSLKSTLLGETGVLPALTEFMNGITGLIIEMKQEGLADTIEGIGTAFSTTVQEINGQNLTAQSIIDAMEALGNPDLFTAEDEAQWEALYEELAKVFPEIKTMFGEQATATDVSTESLRAHIKALTDDAKAQAYAKAISERQEALQNAYAEQTEAQVQASVAQKKADRLGATWQSYASGLTDSQLRRIQSGTNSDVEFMYADAISDEALQAYADYQAALTAAAKKEQEFQQVSEELNATISENEEWLAAMAELAGLNPDEVAGTTSEVLDNIQSSSEEAVDTVTKAVEECKSQLDGLSGTYVVDVEQRYTGTNYVEGSHASGLDYVPHDNYLAYLHEGERVLTKSENERYSGGLGENALAAYMARPISFSVGDTALATSLATASGRANATRAAAISSGYGRGMA